MRKIVVFSKKRVKEVSNLIKKQWGAVFDFRDYVLIETKDGRFSIISKNFADLPLDKLRINMLGLYFGQLRNGSLRVSIEGSQILGPFATKNVFELDKGLAKLWIAGYDLEVKDHPKEFVLVKYKDDFLGSGKVKDNKLFNFVPKPRRLIEVNLL